MCSCLVVLLYDAGKQAAGITLGVKIQAHFQKHINYTFNLPLHSQQGARSACHA